MCEKYLAPRKTVAGVRVIHNGVDASNGWNNPLAHEGYNIIACGKWRRPKRLKEIINIFDTLNQQYPQAPNVNLHIVGGFKKGGSEIVHDKVTYYGQVTHDRMKQIYRQGDMFLHMCKKDSYYCSG